MKNLLVTLAPEFEEIETITVVDILRRAGVRTRVTLVDTVTGLIEGSRGIKIAPDTILDAIMDKEFDLIYLPSGNLGTNNLKNDLRIAKVLRKMQDQGKYFSAICAAPIILQKVGILINRSMT
jgi:protein deglycase